MAKKSTSPPRSSPLSAVTAERFSRLYRLVRFLDIRPQTRTSITRKLRLDVRGFYRDLELLRSAGIVIMLSDGLYALEQDLSEALERLPFPDPHMTLGEIQQLARGRTNAHRRLAEQIARIVR